MKYCSKCGEQNTDYASFCSKCGANITPFEETITVQPEPSRQSYNQQQEKPPIPNTYLWQSIVVTILCCMPFGIAAIVNATQVESRYNQGNYEGAQRASRNAKNFSIWSLVAAGIFYLGYGILVFFGVLAGIGLEGLGY